MQQQQQSLASGIKRPFRFVSVLLGLTLVSTVGLAVYALGVLQPRIVDTSVVTRQVRASHEGALDEQTGLRGWLATGDPRFLEAVRIGRSLSDDANRNLDAQGGPLILRFRLAQQTWLGAWADPARQVDPHQTDERELNDLLRDDKFLFDAYREVQSVVIDALADDRDRAVDGQRVGLQLWLVVEGILLAGALAVAYLQCRRVIRSVADPVDDLLRTIDRIGEGDLDARPTGGGPLELARIATSLSDMATTLAEQDEAATERGIELEVTAERLHTILELGREIAGSISLRYVAAAAATAAQRVSGAEHVVIRLLEGTNAATLVAVHDTRATANVEAGKAGMPLGEGPGGEAARDARTSSGIADGVRTTAYPLVVGARVIGVLEVHHVGEEELTSLVDGLLETLAAHTAAALEAARLHGQAETLSKVDALTQLANRRRLDDDLAAECARSARYGRPLGVVMIDLDHFKRLNDDFGHQYGDEVLQRVATILAHEVRATDTVYRYGGEELVVVARESTVEDTAGMAERLRRALEADAGIQARTTVTASFGVAGAPWDASSPEGLVAAADRALYDAKRNGRNRVELAQRPEVTSDGPEPVLVASEDR